MPTPFLFPPGRLVYGHPNRKTAKTDVNTKQKVLRDGKEIMQSAFGVAYDKALFMQQIWPVLQSVVNPVYPQPPQHFAWKFKDGDGVDRQGKPFRDREGYAGHYVVSFATEWDIPAFRPAGGQWQQISEKDYKTGDYIAVSSNLECNKPQNTTFTPGLYINPVGILHIGNGSEIINRPSADQMFGGQQFALPPGAQPPGSAPAVPAGMPIPPGMPQSGQPAFQPPQQPAYAVPQYAPQQPAYAAPQYAPQPQAPQYAPAPDFVQGAMGQPGNPMQPAGYAPTPAYPANMGQAAPVQSYQQPAVGIAPYPSNPPMPGAPVAGMPPGFPVR